MESEDVRGEGGREAEGGREGEVRDFAQGWVPGEEGEEEGFQAAAVAAGVPEMPFLHQDLGKLQTIRLEEEGRAGGREGGREASTPLLLERGVACTAAAAAAALAIMLILLSQELHYLSPIESFHPFLRPDPPPSLPPSIHPHQDKRLPLFTNHHFLLPSLPSSGQEPPKYVTEVCFCHFFLLH